MLDKKRGKEGLELGFINQTLLSSFLTARKGKEHQEVEETELTNIQNHPTQDNLGKIVKISKYFVSNFQSLYL